MRVSEQIPFAVQVGVWGAAWDGDDLAERTAMLAEKGDCALPAMWDRTAANLCDQVIIDNDGVTRVPDWWALPWLADHIVRGHEEYSPVRSGERLYHSQEKST